MAAALQRRQRGAPTVVIEQPRVTRVVLHPASVESRLEGLVRDIKASPAFSEERCAMANRIVEKLPVHEAITALFLEVVAPLIEDGEDRIDDIFDQAEKLYTEHGDKEAFIEEEAQEIAVALLPGYIRAATGALSQELGAWQDQIAASVDEANERRVHLVEAAQENATAALHRIGAVAEGIVTIGKRMDSIEGALSSALDDADRVIRKTVN